MKIHEYQAKALFKAYGIPTPRGTVAQTPEETLRAAYELGTSPLVVKAQVHAGGRGKGGGIRVVGAPAEAREVASQLLGTRLITPQTGEEGRPVETLLIEEALTIEEEIYLGIVIDRSRACPVVLASSEGGMEIEKVAAEHRGKVIIEDIDPAVGLRPFQANRICYDLKVQTSMVREMTGLILNLSRLFTEKDCSLAEINPLVVTDGGDLVALDAKLNFDDNALFRHPEIMTLRDLSQENPLEVEASRYNLNYIKLKGNVGCMVNGAGLAMATMDLIKLVGAEPANFLDVGGGATAEMVREGFKLLLSDRDVRVIFVNIFGGILRCDTLAQGVVEATRELGVNMPMVVRLEGTNVEEGRRILAESGLRFTVAVGLRDAAEKVAASLPSKEGIES
ncbi:MAG: Succinyl-CoA ligase (ADP-forming) subunit beta [Syntrophorhabdus sp. PtaU1.Bin050]|nr:MAG: Succinyl-CoA ligase (ADP-forming) subunit beta [Syntrophorhabdus sp. PtaU1.Bin050]